MRSLSAPPCREPEGHCFHSVISSVREAKGLRHTPRQIRELKEGAAFAAAFDDFVKESGIRECHDGLLTVGGEELMKTTKPCLAKNLAKRRIADVLVVPRYTTLTEPLLYSSWPPREPSYTDPALCSIWMSFFRGIDSHVHPPSMSDTVLRTSEPPWNVRLRQISAEHMVLESGEAGNHPSRSGIPSRCNPSLSGAQERIFKKWVIRRGATSRSGDSTQ